MTQPFPRTLAVLFGVLTVVILATTPFLAGWSMRPLSCDLGPSPDWVATIVNVRHLLAYGLHATVAFLLFRGKPIWIPIVLVLVVSAGVEIEEGLFEYGHCRVRDMLPNMIGIGLGWLIAFGIGRIRRNRLPA